MEKVGGGFDMLMMKTKRDLKQTVDFLVSDLQADAESYREEQAWDRKEGRPVKLTEAARRIEELKAMLDRLPAAMTAYVAAEEKVTAMTKELDGATDERRTELLRKIGETELEAYKVWATWLEDKTD